MKKKTKMMITHYLLDIGFQLLHAIFQIRIQGIGRFLVRIGCFSICVRIYNYKLQLKILSRINCWVNVNWPGQRTRKIKILNIML